MICVSYCHMYTYGYICKCHPPFKVFRDIMDDTDIYVISYPRIMISKESFYCFVSYPLPFSFGDFLPPLLNLKCFPDDSF